MSIDDPPVESGPTTVAGFYACLLSNDVEARAFVEDRDTYLLPPTGPPGTCAVDLTPAQKDAILSEDDGLSMVKEELGIDIKRLVSNT